jgi:hypothetical protein
VTVHGGQERVKRSKGPERHRSDQRRYINHYVLQLYTMLPYCS